MDKDKYSDLDFFINQLTKGYDEAWEHFQAKYINYIYACIINVFNRFNLKLKQEDLEDCYMGALERIWLKLSKLPHPHEKAFRKGIGILTGRNTFNYIDRYIMKHTKISDKGKRQLKKPDKKDNEFLEIINKVIINNLSSNNLKESVDLEEHYEKNIELFDICNKILTEEENWVFKLKLSGCSNREIADFLNIPIKRVSSRLESAISKLKTYFNEDTQKT